jgi:hypothetical protein
MKQNFKKFIFLPILDSGPRYPSGQHDLLLAGLSGDRIPVGANLSLPVPTEPGANTVSYIIGKESFPGVQRPGPGVDQQHTASAEVRERVGLYI